VSIARAILRWLFLSRAGQALLLALAIAGGLWWLHGYIDGNGYARAQTEHAAALADAQEAQRRAEAARDTAAAELADRIRAETQARITVIGSTSQAAAERVRTIVREVPTPIGCPDRLPDSVNEEGQAAVNRANEARRNRKERRAGR
jgi:hypothetical protein